MHVKLKITPQESFKIKVEDAIKKPKIITINNFDEESTKNFNKEFAEAIETGQSFIPVVIDSFGGYVYSVFAMIDTIKNSPIPVATIATGKAMSSGVLLLSSGTEDMRFATPNTNLMIHEVSDDAFGKNLEIQSRAENTKKINKKFFHILSTNCGHDKDYFEKIYRNKKERADWYLDVKEAKKHNIINHIGFPSIDMEVKVNMKIKCVPSTN